MALPSPPTGGIEQLVWLGSMIQGEVMICIACTSQGGMMLWLSVADVGHSWHEKSFVVGTIGLSCELDNEMMRHQ